MLGDNLYGGSGEKDYQKKFERPYKPLLDAGVKFYASLGNHDDPNQRFYKPFNMNGERFYTFKPKPGVRFFALDSNYMDKHAARLAGEGARGERLGLEDRLLPPSALLVGRHARLRRRSCATQLEPLFLKYGVDVGVLRATSTSTSASSRRRASTTSCPAAPRSCAKGDVEQDRA